MVFKDLKIYNILNLAEANTKKMLFLQLKLEAIYKGSDIF